MLIESAPSRPPEPSAVAAARARTACTWAFAIICVRTGRAQIVSVVTVLAADQPAAVAVALAVVSDALKSVRLHHPPADGPL